MLPPEDSGPARRLAVGGVAARLAGSAAMRARLGLVGEVYGQSRAAVLARLENGCSAAGAALLAARGGRSRGGAALGGALVLAGELAMRWSVFRAGFQSALDPKYVVVPQRERLRAAGSAGATATGARYQPPTIPPVGEENALPMGGKVRAPW